MKDDDGRELKDANLVRLKSKIETAGWKALTKDEVHRYQSSLLDLKKGDWVVYVNVPQWGECTIARVAGPYYWEQTDEDFNHRFPVDYRTVRKFARNADIVHPALRARLGLQAKFWRIYVNQEFEALLAALNSGVVPKIINPRDADINRLRLELEPLLMKISERIHHLNPNFALESLLELVFKSVPGVRKVTRQGGSGDHGADLIVEFEDGLPFPLQAQHLCIVQIKSYRDDHWDLTAVRDIERAFIHYPSADMGLIISTAKATKALDDETVRLRQTSGKRIELLIGSDVSKFILRYGGAVLE